MRYFFLFFFLCQMPSYATLPTIYEDKELDLNPPKIWKYADREDFHWELLEAYMKVHKMDYSALSVDFAYIGWFYGGVYPTAKSNKAVSRLLEAGLPVYAEAITVALETPKYVTLSTSCILNYFRECEQE